MKNNLSNSTKLILLHPYIQKQGTTSNRLWPPLALISLLTLFSLLTLIYTRDSISTTTATITTAAAATTPHLSNTITRALAYYASTSNTTEKMSFSDIKQISDALRHQCSHACNFLVFGLTNEALLWKAINHNGRTVFIDENRYYAAYFEEKHPGIEAYDVHYSTRLSDAAELVAAAKAAAGNECRPVQNLLFSECRLGLNDLPNQLYEVDWDVILVDGPRGYWPEAPGRMAAIFTAAVLARSKRGGGGGAGAKTHVFVHDFNMEVDRVTSDEFLCRENLVKGKDMMGHFVLERVEGNPTHFCRHSSSSSS